MGVDPSSQSAVLVGIIVGTVDPLGIPSRVCVDDGYAVAVRVDQFIRDAANVGYRKSRFDWPLFFFRLVLRPDSK